MHIVMLGPNGSGKGTQAKLLRNRLGVPHISTGDLLRAAVQARTAAGVQAEAIMAEGKLVPDELVLAVLADRLADADAAKGFVLDGYPRTLSQATALDELLADKQLSLRHAVVLLVPDEVILERCRIRYEAEHRPDDDPDVVRERLAVYHNQTQPVIDRYAARGIAAMVEGVGTVAEVSERILATLPR
ncbi:adenylate kinase [Nocardia altamirensis]|uniref:adenylate kinase n=1 Tax=Nocardia altamirensis TaxID=472158 RepID=UPI000840890C|nr:adenylate kinase [Nocardia altamirensis]